MFSHLQLANRRERLIVGLADLGLTVAAPILIRAPKPSPEPPGSILLLRLERMGDLLMTLDAFAAVRALAPRATIDLVVGRWNGDLAQLVPGIDRVEILSPSWLARGGASEGYSRLARRASTWRARRYDLAINFEGDIRSHVLLGLSGAARRVGFDMAGGGPMLTDRVGFDASVHTRVASLTLVERAFDLPAGSLARKSRDESAGPPLRIPEDARERASRLIGPFRAPGAPVVALHVSGGREIKQWHLDRFGEAASRLAALHGARILFTGSPDDRPLIDAVRRSLAPTVPVLDVAGRVDVVTLAALLDGVDLLVTADTGPMHLAATLGVPIVAIFGPSDPARWGPLSNQAEVVRVQLPCSPCNRIRQPPARCRGHVPDCLAEVTVEQVLSKAEALLHRRHR